MDEEILGVDLVAPKSIDGLTKIVVLDQIEPGEIPEYCVHGKTTCYICEEWCWLGDNTLELVRSGEVAGVCKQCASRHLSAYAKPVERIEDHRRADGPHQ